MSRQSRCRRSAGGCTGSAPRQRFKPAASEAGFTIIELLIATLIFTVILIVITLCVMQFTRQYYRGVIASRTQNVARQLMDDVVQTIQFAPGTVYELHHLLPSDSPSASPVGYCVGQSARYSFRLDQQVTDSPPYGAHQGPHALVADTTGGCSTATAALDVRKPNVLTAPDPNIPSPPTPPTDARELLGMHMRLAKFSIDRISGGPLDGAYTVTIRVVYGDDDLLTDPASPDTQCKSQVGDSFCAVAELSTTVEKRVN